VIRVVLKFEMGTISISGPAHVPFSVVDPRTGNKISRAPAMQYSNIKDYVMQSGMELSDYVMDLIPSPELSISKDAKLVLRDYQKKSLSNWGRAGMKGCVVLPTGSGKTLVGVKAIEKVNAASLVVVPTIDLMDQWRSVLSKYFKNVKVGMLGGGEDDIQPITVATYDSAYIRAPLLGNRFALLIFDEVHHLAAPGYRTIAEQFASPYRLGLTATMEREDNMHKDIPSLVGGVVFEAFPEELANKKHLAPYEIERRRVEMLPSEVQEYNRHFGLYQVGLKKLGLRMNYPGSFQRLIMMAGRNPAAREAMLARNKAMDIALNSRAKLEELKEILSEYRGAKTLVFTQHNKLVHDISSKFFIPSITHKTGKEERQDVLGGFKEGRYMAIVTSKVLDEGVDVPDAELGVILSGTGSSREFIQRLGRLLRPKPEAGKKATLVEIVSSDTREVGTSAKRKRGMKDASSRGTGEEGR